MRVVLYWGKVMSQKGQVNRNNGQWPIAVTLVLCALFVAAILLKAKNEFDSSKTTAFDSVYSSAQVIASDLDADLLGLKSAIVAVAPTSIEGAAQYIASSGKSDIVAIFDEAGNVVSSNATKDTDNIALSAASQLGTDVGWIGTIAQNDGRFIPAISVRNLKNQSVAATLKISPNKSLKSGQSLIVADNKGTIIYSTEALKMRGEKNVKTALNIPSLPIANVFWGQNINASNGEKYLGSGAVSRSGMIVFVLSAKNNAFGAFMRTGLFYFMLLLGPILAFLGIWFIVRDQKTRSSFAQYQMREAERRLRIAIDGAKCGVWDWNITDDTVYLTQRLAKTFDLDEAGRYPTEEILKYLSNEDKLRLRAALRAAVQMGVIDFTVPLLNNGNDNNATTIIQFRGRAASHKDDKTNIRIIGVSIDVTEQQKNETKLNAAETRLRDAIASFSGPFALWGRDGGLAMWNEAFIKVFELDLSEVTIGTKYDDISKASSAAIISRRIDNSDEMAQEIQMRNGTWLRMVERRTSDGGMLSLGLDITTQKNNEDAQIQNSKNYAQVVDALRISERAADELAKNYEQEKIRAQNASKSKDVFLANMSHELRTPLNAIIGFSDMMMREMYGPLGNPNYREYIRDINQSGVHLLELINGVLDMAKIESGHFKIYPQNMSVEEAIDQSIRIIRGKADEKQINIEQELANDDEIVADARAVRQILINLLTNAVKFTDNGGRILVRTRRDDDNIIFSVIDNGIGIDEEDLERLARPFEQVENEHSRLNQGTGLGLALCKSFATMHGGSMQITSRIGIGTKVDIILPMNARFSEEVAA
jgi:two-component system, cell cycle sensor histidine kinase PleC